MEQIGIMRTLSAMARHAERRQNVIAENIANANTPGYKAVDLKSFAEIYKATHRSGQDITKMVADAHPIKTDDPAKPNGNTVSLEEQMLRSAETLGEHDMALLIYRKSLDMLKMAMNKNM